MSDTTKDGTPIAERWVLIATGEGAASTVVSDIREGLHTFSCCCGKTLDECGDESTLYILKEMEDLDNYFTDEAGKPFQYRYEHECGSVTITRLDSWEELSAAEEQIGGHLERIATLEAALAEANLYAAKLKAEMGKLNDKVARLEAPVSDAEARNLWYHDEPHADYRKQFIRIIAARAKEQP